MKFFYPHLLLELYIVFILLLLGGTCSSHFYNIYTTSTRYMCRRSWAIEGCEWASISTRYIVYVQVWSSWAAKGCEGVFNLMMYRKFLWNVLQTMIGLVWMVLVLLYIPPNWQLMSSCCVCVCCVCVCVLCVCVCVCVCVCLSVCVQNMYVTFMCLPLVYR